MLLVLLGAYSLGDPLFLPQLARDLAARKEGLVLVHGSGEAGERALEARGAFPEAEGGVWKTTSDAERAEVERATRDLNRRVVHELNEAGVPAVRVMAADRGLLVRDGGGVRAGKTAWLGTLVGQGGVAVVAALVAGDGGAADAGGAPLVEVDAALAAAALAGALGAEAVATLVSGRTAGLAGPGGVLASVSVGGLAAGGPVPDVGLVRRLVGASAVPVVATVAASLRAPGVPAGTRLTP